MQFVSWNINFKAKTVFYCIFVTFCLNFNQGWLNTESVHPCKPHMWLTEVSQSRCDDWPDLIPEKRSWYIGIICLLRQLVPAQLFRRLGEVLNVTACPAVSLEVSPHRDPTPGPRWTWGPSYWCSTLVARAG